MVEVGDTRPRQRFWRADTLRLRTIRLALTVLLPAFALAALLLWNMELQARRSLNDQLIKTAKALSLVVDRELGERAAVLDALVVSQRLLRGDYPAFDQQARAAVGRSLGWVVVQDLEFNPLVNTRAPAGAALPKSSTTASAFAGQRASGHWISNVVEGSVARQPVVSVSRVVTLEDGRQVRVGIVALASDFDAIFRDQGLPERWTGAVVDARHRLVARSRDSATFRGSSTTDDMRTALEQHDSGVLRTHTLEGFKTVSAYQRLPGYRWSVLVGVPRSEMSPVAGGALLWGTALAILLLGGSLLLALREARQIEAPVRNLARAAAAWRQGQAFRLDTETGPAEIREMAAAFGEALRALEAANSKLSDQVSARTQEFERIWQLSRDAFVIADEDGVWQRVSPAWTDILGWTEGELVGRSPRWLLHPDDQGRGRTEDEQQASGLTATRFANRLRTRAGEYRWFAWTAVLHEGLRYCVARDITAEKEAAFELERAQVALRQSQKMDAIGHLTGGVAHDFNNLLTPILGALDVILRRGDLKDRDKRLVGAAGEAAERARVLVQRLLAFARRQPLQPRSVDIGRLIRDAATLIQSTVGARVQLLLRVPEDLPAALADPNELEMALLNLAVNARDAMPDGGVLTIEVEARAAAKAEVGGVAAGRYLVIRVSDTGVGMDETTLVRAIEPFFSTKGIGKGTGLGLSMVHGLAAQLGGALFVRSAPGAGATVELWLPTTAAPAAPPAVEDAAPTAEHSGLVLLIDDEALVRVTTGDMLAGLGYSVVEASSAREALSLIEGGLRPRLIVSDHLMPDMTGAELVAALSQAYPQIPVLIISGYAEASGLPEHLPRLRKPFLQSELALSLQTLTAARVG